MKRFSFRLIPFFCLGLVLGGGFFWLVQARSEPAILGKKSRKHALSGHASSSQAFRSRASLPGQPDFFSSPQRQEFLAGLNGDCDYSSSLDILIREGVNMPHIQSILKKLFEKWADHDSDGALSGLARLKKHIGDDDAYRSIGGLRSALLGISRALEPEALMASGVRGGKIGNDTVIPLIGFSIALRQPTLSPATIDEELRKLGLPENAMRSARAFALAETFGNLAAVNGQELLRSLTDGQAGELDSILQSTPDIIDRTAGLSAGFRIWSPCRTRGLAGR